MATNTYVALDLKTVTSAVSSVTFTSIPSTYTDLVLVVNALGVGTNVDENCSIQLNGDTGSNYSTTRIRGNGSAASSDRDTSATSAIAGIITVKSTDDNTRCNFTVNFQNYANTTTYKTWLSRSNSAAYNVQAMANLWRSTSAINSIKFQINSNNFAVGSTFSLYGIKAEGASGTKATGGAIYSDSTYFYHVFGATGTFTPTQSLTADVLVVAGGGGSGRYYGGGAGAGGLTYYASQSLTATGYTCTVGAGGSAGTASTGSSGTQGSNSQFGALTASVGGGLSGGSNSGAVNGGTGGSGGGGGGTGSGTGGAATSGQGYAGSAGSSGNAGGGGGGAGGAAGAASSNNGGDGGVGSSTYSSWGVATGVGQNVSGTYYLAGGGGGSGAFHLGTGGYGGGGLGGNDSYRGYDGSANTGGGGGGGSSVQVAGAGGSGVIIVRYAK